MNRQHPQQAENREYVYCSGPLFCPEELGGMTALANVVETAGYGTFLPHRDGLEAHLMKFVNTPLGINIFRSRNISDRLIFALDVYQIIERCRYFIMNMNGRVPDEGAVAETAMAFMVGKPVLLYKNDCRTVFSGRDNSMVTGLASLPRISRLKDIPRAIIKLSGRLQHSNAPFVAGESLPANVKQTISLGRRIWKVMTLVSAAHGPSDETAELINIIARDTSRFCAQDDNTVVE